MKILAISDLHGKLLDRKEFNAVDVCCLVGDLLDDTLTDNLKISYVIEVLFKYISSFKNIKFIYVSGNHDSQILFIINKYPSLVPSNFTYLNNSSIIYNKISFYGMPYVIEDRKIDKYPFYQEYIDKHISFVKNIDKIDILLTHNCPISKHYSTGTSIVNFIIGNKNPKYVFCGHNHDDTKDQIKIKNSIIYNVSQYIRLIEFDGQ